MSNRRLNRKFLNNLVFLLRTFSTEINFAKIFFFVKSQNHCSLHHSIAQVLKISTCSQKVCCETGKKRRNYLSSISIPNAWQTKRTLRRRKKIYQKTMQTHCVYGANAKTLNEIKEMNFERCFLALGLLCGRVFVSRSMYTCVSFCFTYANAFSSFCVMPICVRTKGAVTLQLTGKTIGDF